jgi:Ca2+-binding RTX toxin-like protein
MTFPAAAPAATVSSDGTTITFQALPGEANFVTVSESGTDYRFNDTGTALTLGVGCAQVDANTVDCPKAAPTSVVVNLNDMDDVFRADGSDATTPVDEDPFTINGEAGADLIRGSEGPDAIAGGPGDDRSGPDEGLLGQFGNDTVSGGTGDDYLFGGAGDDDLFGGDDNDRLEDIGGADDYDGGLGIDRALFDVGATCADQPVIVTIDDVANDQGCRTTDGADAGNNVMTTIESITASRFGDTITGSCFANTISGEEGTTNNNVGGNDTLRGDPTTGCTPGSSDFLGGGEGSDTLFGDAAVGAAGVDTVTYGIPYTGVGDLSIVSNGGAVSNDGWGNTAELVGGTVERIIGNSGNDTLNATLAEQAVQLFGRLGNDTLTDSAFDDLLDGEGGTDTVNCPNGGTDSYRSAEVVNGACEMAL